jgi:polyhydroxyalkanoate synthase
MHWLPGGDDSKNWPTLEEWLAHAQEGPGSWWPEFANWLGALSGEKIPARIPGLGLAEALDDAPGRYVRM